MSRLKCVHSRVGAFLLCLLTVTFTLGAAGCKSPSLIDNVEFKAEPNLETVKVQMNFGKDVQSDLGGTFAVKDYGTVEIEPSTPDSRFNVGFRLNLDIFYDADYTDPVKFRPVTTLPSGQPLPVAVNRALVQVKMEDEVHPHFDVYAYVDVARQEWLGMAMTLKFINDKYFPPGLSVTKNFLKDSQKRPRAAGAVFGPKVNNRNELEVPGGIAIFANVKALLTSAARANLLAGRDSQGSPYMFAGPTAPYYRKNPEAALRLEETFKKALSQNMRRGRRGD